MPAPIRAANRSVFVVESFCGSSEQKFHLAVAGLEGDQLRVVPGRLHAAHRVVERLRFLGGVRGKIELLRAACPCLLAGKPEQLPADALPAQGL